MPRSPQNYSPRRHSTAEPQPKTTRNRRINRKGRKEHKRRNRNISRKACPERRRRDAKAQKKTALSFRPKGEIFLRSLASTRDDGPGPSLGAFAPWREEYPNPRCFIYRKICASREIFKPGNTKVAKRCRGDRLVAQLRCFSLHPQRFRGEPHGSLKTQF
jgi:hypothetical protein